MIRSRHPPGGVFFQQRLPFWDPSYTTGFASLLFVCGGLIFLALGIIIICGSIELKLIEISYGGCLGANRVAHCYSTICVCQLNFTLSEDIPGPVFLYYQLTNFYQNHRLYVQSMSNEQFLGRPSSKSQLNKCYPLDLSKGNQYALTYLPCGHMANSIFNDTFEIFYVPNSFTQGVSNTSSNLTETKRVPFEVHDLVPYPIKARKYGRLSYKALVNTTKPEFWRQTALERDPDAFVGDERLMVWMQPAPLPIFRKLTGVLNTSNNPFNNGLPKGLYVIVVGYNFPLSNGGDKQIIIANTNALGGKNSNLGYLFVAASILEIGIGIIFTVLMKRHTIGIKSVDEFFPKRPPPSTIVRNSNFKSIYQSREERIKSEFYLNKLKQVSGFRRSRDIESELSSDEYMNNLKYPQPSGSLRLITINERVKSVDDDADDEFKSNEYVKKLRLLREQSLQSSDSTEFMKHFKLSRSSKKLESISDWTKNNNSAFRYHGYRSCKSYKYFLLSNQEYELI